MIRAALAVTLLLCLAPVAWAQGSRPAKKAPAKQAVASLGLKATRAPTDAERKRFTLPKWVRVLGRIVVTVTPGGPAAKAKLAPGDVVLRLARNPLYSDDDVRDFERASQPGRKVRVQVVRAKQPKRREWVELTLGQRTVAVAKSPRVRWQFASRGQLPLALAQAKKQRRWLLVGLSGAET